MDTETENADPAGSSPSETPVLSPREMSINAEEGKSPEGNGASDARSTGTGQEPLLVLEKGEREIQLEEFRPEVGAPTETGNGKPEEQPKSKSVGQHLVQALPWTIALTFLAWWSTNRYAPIRSRTALHWIIAVLAVLGLVAYLLWGFRQKASVARTNA